MGVDSCLQVHLRVFALSHSPVARSRESRVEGRIAMAESNCPGPGRSTVDEALNEVKEHVARRNEEAQKAARELRAARAEEQLERRRKSHY